MDSLYNLVFEGEDTGAEAMSRLPIGLDHVQLPFQKFPRNPEL